MFSGDACNMNTLLAAMGQPATERTCVTALKQTAESWKHCIRITTAITTAISAMLMPKLYADAGVFGAGLYRSVRKLARRYYRRRKVENPFCGECRLARNNTMQIVYRDDQVK